MCQYQVSHFSFSIQNIGKVINDEGLRLLCHRMRSHLCADLGLFDGPYSSLQRCLGGQKRRELFLAVAAPGEYSFYVSKMTMK